MWTPDARVRLAGDSASVEYGAALPWSEGAQVSIPSVNALRVEVARFWLGITDEGSRRPSGTVIAPGSRDPHPQGFAIDWGVRAGPQRSIVGSSLADWLVTHADLLCVQNVIFDRLSWTARGTGTRFEAYDGSDPHDAHIHCEVSPAGRALSADAMRSRVIEARASLGGVGLLTSPTTYLPIAGATAAAVAVCLYLR